MRAYAYMMEVKFHLLIVDEDKDVVLDNISTQSTVIYRGTNVDDNLIREIERITFEKFTASRSGTNQ